MGILIICASMAAYAAPQVNDQTIISQQPSVSNGVLQMHGSDNGEMVCEGHGLNAEQCQAIGCYSSVGQNQCFGTNHVHFGNTHIHTYTHNTQTSEQTRIGNVHIGNTKVKVNLNLKNLQFDVPQI